MGEDGREQGSQRGEEKYYGEGLTLPCSRCMTLSKSLNLTVTQSLHL